MLPPCRTKVCMARNAMWNSGLMGAVGVGGGGGGGVRLTHVPDISHVSTHGVHKSYGRMHEFEVQFFLHVHAHFHVSVSLKLYMHTHWHLKARINAYTQDNKGKHSNMHMQHAHRTRAHTNVHTHTGLNSGRTCSFLTFISASHIRRIRNTLLPRHF